MLHLWREKARDVLLLDDTPSGKEEEENLYNQEVESPHDLNQQILAERKQDMKERIIYADRAFLVTMIWVIFLVILAFVQIFVSFFEVGLTDAQFVTVVTTTTGSVFGFWFLVGRYLHPNNHSPDNNEPNA